MFPDAVGSPFVNASPSFAIAECALLFSGCIVVLDCTRRYQTVFDGLSDLKPHRLQFSRILPRFPFGAPAISRNATEFTREILATSCGSPGLPENLSETLPKKFEEKS